MLRSLFKILLPPKSWRLPVIIALGVFCGLGLFILYISNAVSYLSDAPQTCMNCHIMAPQFSSWAHSSHRDRANCNDCHVPHDNLFNHYYFKAKDGMRHSMIFTFRMEPQVIQMHEAGQKVVHANCIRCHTQFLEHPNLGLGQKFEDRRCWECHRETPHGGVRSLSSVPNARVPTLEGMFPDWLRTEQEAVKPE